MMKVVIKLLVTWWEHRLCLGVEESFTRESTFEFGMKNDWNSKKRTRVWARKCKTAWWGNIFIVVAWDDMAGSLWSLIIKGSLCLLSSRQCVERLCGSDADGRGGRALTHEALRSSQARDNEGSDQDREE